MRSITELSNPNVQVIGHRGHVSAYPENSIEGFISAVAVGADALEMDLVISKDHQVIVSHEPYMKASYMISPEGKRINKNRERDYNLYEMTYDSIQQYIHGMLPNAKFHKQRQIYTHKPLLTSVLDTVQAFIKDQNLEPVKYYLEIKSDPGEYNIFQPQPEEFAAVVMEIVKEKNLEDQVVLMSFDRNIINIIQHKYPHIKVSYLLYRKGIEKGLREVTIQPEYISPYYKQLKNAETVTSLQNRGLKVVPWTVNRKNDILNMLNYGVDGIISDYPERVLKEKNKLSPK